MVYALGNCFARSLDGDGNFNWRMVFPFDFMPIEKKVVVRRKVRHFTDMQYDCSFYIHKWLLVGGKAVLIGC